MYSRIKLCNCIILETLVFWYFSFWVYSALSQNCKLNSLQDLVWIIICFTYILLFNFVVEKQPNSSLLYVSFIPHTEYFTSDISGHQTCVFFSPHQTISCFWDGFVLTSLSNRCLSFCGVRMFNQLIAMPERVLIQSQDPRLATVPGANMAFKNFCLFLILYRS